MVCDLPRVRSVSLPTDLAPWVCATCHSNNAPSHATCDVCGSDKRLSSKGTSDTTETLRSPSRPVFTKAGIIAAVITFIVMFMTMIIPSPFNDYGMLAFIQFGDDGLILITVHLPIVLATLMYGRVIALINIPWFLFMMVAGVSSSESILWIIPIAFLPLLIVFSTWSTYAHLLAPLTKTVSDVVILTLASLAGTSIIIIFGLLGDALRPEIDIWPNVLMMLIITPLWWFALKHLHPHPHMLIMFNVEETE
jgi:hypothetical protein